MIKEWLLGIGVSVGLGYAFVWAKKEIPNYLSAWLSDKIDKAFSAGDEIDDELLCHLIIWAEKKVAKEFPMGGMGEVKYEMVANKLISMLPISIRPFISPKNEKLKEIIEATVLKLQETLKEEAEAHSANLPH